jgi:hypothetical protein
MTGTCCFCGAVEELPPDVAPSETLVCDRPECTAKAREFGWHALLSQYIETKEGPDGTMMFRLRNVAT